MEAELSLREEKLLMTQSSYAEREQLTVVAERAAPDLQAPPERLVARSSSRRSAFLALACLGADGAMLLAALAIYASSPGPGSSPWWSAPLPGPRLCTFA